MSSAASSEEREIDQAAFRRLKPTIDLTYPHGRFIGIFGGTVVADAASLEELLTVLQTKGLDSPEVLVFQAGVDYSEKAFILMGGKQQ